MGRPICSVASISKIKTLHSSIKLLQARHVLAYSLWNTEVILLNLSFTYSKLFINNLLCVRNPLDKGDITVNKTDSHCPYGIHVIVNGDGEQTTENQANNFANFYR